ncbi:MAG: hypothetical protein JST00_10845 [Deltaproteobacteria bacterium]|nr:hypothetical protein [Deltaproteobacteria bacterium]
MEKTRAIFLSGAAVGAMACVIACIPHPDKDFEDYAERTATFSGSTSGTVDAGPIDASVITEPTEGLYYGACLSQLAFGAPNKVFNFYTKTKFTPGVNGADGKLTLTLQALKLKDNPGGANPPAPPETFSKAGLLPPEQTSKEVPVQGTKVSIEFNDVAGRPGLVVVPGDANPITGRDVEIEKVKLTGIFAKEKFCALLNGTVVKPLNLELTPTSNVCQFIPVKDGDKTPVLTKPEDFAASSCPQ